MKTLEEILEQDYTAVDIDQRYDEFLDCEGPVSVAGLEYYPSRILSEIDPTAYNCGLSDFIDNEDLVEYDGEYYDRNDFDEAESDFDNQENFDDYSHSELCDYLKIDEDKRSDYEKETLIEMAEEKEENN